MTDVFSGTTMLLAGGVLACGLVVAVLLIITVIMIVRRQAAQDKEELARQRTQLMQHVWQVLGRVDTLCRRAAELIAHPDTTPGLAATFGELSKYVQDCRRVSGGMLSGQLPPRWQELADAVDRCEQLCEKVIRVAEQEHTEAEHARAGMDFIEQYLDAVAASGEVDVSWVRAFVEVASRRLAKKNYGSALRNLNKAFLVGLFLQCQARLEVVRRQFDESANDEPTFDRNRVRALLLEARSLAYVPNLDRVCSLIARAVNLMDGMPEEPAPDVSGAEGAGDDVAVAADTGAASGEDPAAIAAGTAASGQEVVDASDSGEQKEDKCPSGTGEIALAPGLPPEQGPVVPPESSESSDAVPSDEPNLKGDDAAPPVVRDAAVKDQDAELVPAGLGATELPDSRPCGQASDQSVENPVQPGQPAGQEPAVVVREKEPSPPSD